MAARILVIDDEADILEMFRLIFEAEGYEVLIASSAYEDAKEVERLAPDLIILDVVIGHQRVGWQMLKDLKDYPPTASIPLILCTAAEQGAQEHQEAAQAQNIPIVHKPFDIDDLLETVRLFLPISAQE